MVNSAIEIQFSATLASDKLWKILLRAILLVIKILICKTDSKKVQKCQQNKNYLQN